MNLTKQFFKTLGESKNSIFFLLALAISFFGMSMFWTGFHDFDNAQNLIFIRDDITINLLKNNINYTMGEYYETTIDGDKLTLEHAYVQGIRKILSSIILIAIGFFMIGYFSRLEDKR